MPKIRVWLHVRDGGDGSASASPYPTEKEAQDAANEEFDTYGQSLNDNVGSMIINTEDYEVVE
jgi:hypothetical protein